MKVRDVMTSAVTTCHPEDTVAVLGSRMWDGDCGLCPVIDGQDRLLGVVTDRDAFVALSTRNARPGDVHVRDVMQRNVTTVMPDDDLRSALRTMAARQVRRLPVVTREGELAGILGLSDALRQNGAADGDYGTAVLEAMGSITAAPASAPSAPTPPPGSSVTPGSPTRR